MNDAAVYQTITVRYEGTTMIIELIDRELLDEHRIRQFGQELLEATNQHSGTTIVVNLRQLGFVSSSWLGALKGQGQIVQRRKGKVFLCSGKPEILEPLKMTGIDRLFTFCYDEQEALIQAKKV